MIKLDNINQINEYFTEDKIGKEIKLNYKAIIPGTGSFLLEKTIQGIFLKKDNLAKNIFCSK